MASQIIVCPGLHSFDPALFACSCRKQDDGQVPCARIVPNRLQQAETVQPGHHDIGQHELRQSAPNRGQRGFSIGHRLDVKLVAEQAHHVLAHIGIVVGDEHPWPTLVAAWLKTRRLDFECSISLSCFRNGIGQPAQRFFDEGVGALEAWGGRSCADLVGREMSRPHWERNDEDRALAQNAFRDNRPAMSLTSSCTRASDAAPFVRTSPGALDAVKSLEEPGHFSGGMPMPLSCTHSTA